MPKTLQRNNQTGFLVAVLIGGVLVLISSNSARARNVIDVLGVVLAALFVLIFLRQLILVRRLRSLAHHERPKFGRPLLLAVLCLALAFGILMAALVGVALYGTDWPPYAVALAVGAGFLFFGILLHMGLRYLQRGTDVFVETVTTTASNDGAHSDT